MKLPRSFFRQIGEKGGRAGKWSAAKRESARHAANVRWMRHREMNFPKKNQLGPKSQCEALKVPGARL